MTKVLIYVEGQTEEIFVRNVLGPHLAARGVYLEPTLAVTKRTKQGKHFKGGVTSYAKTKRDILRLLNDRSAALVTTMIDFYALPKDFPGQGDLPSSSPYQRVEHLEAAFAKDIGHRRFCPFFMLHEFEALLLTRPEVIGQAIPSATLKETETFMRELRGRAPEEINEGRKTHPAARIQSHFPSYNKKIDGPRIVERIGLEAIREKCQHFAHWLARLEGLGDE